jgi:vacuolar-type H+-ATPase subunit I/STV1
MNKKITTTQLNRANKDIWQSLKIAIDTKNWALLEKNLTRLHSLQAYYLERLNLSEIEIRGLQGDLNAEASLRHDFEKEWLEQVAKRAGTYEAMKDRINEIWG